MYGYVGDTTPDTNSLLGIGAFPFSSQPGSLIPGYSAALTDAEAARRGLKPGDQFVDNGRVYRYDDRQPGSVSYVDVYTPYNPPDPGVSQAEIDRQRAIAQGRPHIGAGGPGSEPSLSDTKPDYTSQPPAPVATKPKPVQPVPQKPEPAQAPEASIPRAQLPQNTLASSSFTPVQSSAAGGQKPIKKMEKMAPPQVESPIDLPAYPDEYIDRVYQWLQENPDTES